ncbi:MAG: peptidoglycan DD-metalloendopeptidase family protein, partial [Chloroflexota bacterium]
MRQDRSDKWGIFYSPITLTTLLIAFLLLLISCTSRQEDVPDNRPEISLLPTETNTPVPSPTFTSTPTPTSTPTATATPTHTPSPTPTPTPTTEPVTISGDPVAYTLRERETSFQTRCGTVDTFDFPMDPPNGNQFGRSGSDFGVFRSRYDKYHAGEDWWQPGGALGEPVYSVGHGRVTYAQPLGWGRDKGVIIIEHTFDDGRKILSFYGHLDEESFEVFTGECVQRGELLAKIGKPKTPPHLHFEMRVHEPEKTLGGYWGVDPRTAGWVWPSMRIWEERMRASSGVVWVRPFEATGTRNLGQLPSGRLGIIENGKFYAVDLNSGDQRQFLTSLESPTNGIVSGKKFYVTQKDDVGLIYNFNDNNTLNANIIGEFPTQPNSNQLIARPGGGIIVSANNTLVGIDETGNRLWQTKIGGRLGSFVIHEETIYLTTEGGTRSLWEIPTGKMPQKMADLGGLLTVSGNSLWVYDTNGVYKMEFNAAVRVLEGVKLLPVGDLDRSDLMALPDGGLMIAHVDRDDSRLFSFSADGQVTWERSYRELPRGSQNLAMVNGLPYLISKGGVSSAGEITVYEIDIQNNHLNRIFLGGTRF